MLNNGRRIRLILSNPLGNILEGFLSIPNLPEYFGRWSYPDIAKAHDITPDAARKLYYAGVQRLLSVIIEMDSVDKMTETERKKSGVKRSMRYYEKKTRHK